MAEFYTWSEAARLCLTFLLAMSVLGQTTALVLSHYRHPRSRVRLWENLLEAAVLFQVFVFSLVHGQVMHSYDLSLIAPTDYVVLRYASFAAVTLLACIVARLISTPWPLLVIVVSGWGLPFMERYGGDVYAYLYLAAVLFWILRSVHICMLRYRELRTSLSALSIKNAIDTLHSGVLFGEPDGFILLANAQMQRLMLVLSGKVRHNGWVFYNRLAADEVEPGCRTAEFEGQIVCLLPDETAWMFTKAEMLIEQKTYVQLTASDITQRWNMTAQLQQQEDALKRKSEELKEAIANLHILCRQQETQRAKMRAHDILGERLTLLLRAIRSDNALDTDMLQSLSQGLMDDLIIDPGAPSPQDELDALQQAFGSIGVEIALDGELPQDSARAGLFVDIIREGVTNAVRHAYATEIAVTIEQGHSACRLSVTNNGQPPRGPISEGGGIGGMRHKVEPYGGILDITDQPRFILAVELPGGESYG